MKDPIERADAIAALDDEITIIGVTNAFVVKDYVQRVLRKLRDLPSAHVPDTNVGDMIYRQAAIDEVRAYYDETYCEPEPLSIEERIAALPSAQPQRISGRWVANSPVTMKCDQCGIVIKDWDWFRFKICPGCGAQMEGGDTE